MKKLAFLSMASFLLTYVQGQNTYSNTSAKSKQLIWSIGINPSIPLGQFNTYSSFGLGANFQGEYKPGRAGLTLNIGYIDYFGKTSNGISYSDFKYWPLMGGLKYYLGTSYLHGQLGAGFGSNGLGTSFWYGAGYGFNLGKTMDLELQYMGWHQQLINSTSTSGGTYGGSTTTGTGGGYGGHYPTIGLRLAYNF